MLFNADIWQNFTLEQFWKTKISKRNFHQTVENMKQKFTLIPSLQITFSYKPVICQARDKVWPDMQPVWSDITFVFLKWKYIFLFRVITEEPSQHVRSDSVFASQNPQIGRTNVRCPALICRPESWTKLISFQTIRPRCTTREVMGYLWQPNLW